MVKTYNPKKVLLTVNGTPLSGFADGEFISVERAEEAFKMVTGADGETARAKSNNRAGAITITLLQTSVSNDVLETLAALDELTGQGVFPIFCKDVNGGALFFSATGWVRKRPTAAYSKEVGSRQWVIDCSEMRDEVRGIALPTL